MVWHTTLPSLTVLCFKSCDANLLCWVSGSTLFHRTVSPAHWLLANIPHSLECVNWREKMAKGQVSHVTDWKWLFYGFLPFKKDLESYMSWIASESNAWVPIPDNKYNKEINEQILPGSYKHGGVKTSSERYNGRFMGLFKSCWKYMSLTSLKKNRCLQEIFHIQLATRLLQAAWVKNSRQVPDLSGFTAWAD